MTNEEIQKLKDITMKPPIFSSFDSVKEMRVKADTIRMFGAGEGGRKTPADKFLERELRRRADKMEKELIVDLLTTPKQ